LATGAARRIAARYQCKVELSFEEDASGLCGFSEYCYCPKTKQVVETEDYQRWRKPRNKHRKRGKRGEKEQEE
jgi:hypothetical protein